MVWHGNYIRYFEDGREDFGKKYNFSYWDIYKNENLAVPLVHVECDYKKFVSFGEDITIETVFIDNPAAKILFEYTIRNNKNEIICTGKSVQVFLEMNKKELFITQPPFYENWKKAYLK
jgi:acyl-CoA thioester hydrolase